MKILIFLFLNFILISSECLDCSDYGHCVETTVNDTCAQCVCPTGFGGECCEIDAPPTTCDNNPCGSDYSRHFKCDNLAHGLYLCACEAGWTGDNCDQQIDPCNPNPCQNSGNCYNNYGSFGCNCIPEYTGDICESKFLTNKFFDSEYFSVRKECITNPNIGYCDCPHEPCANNATCIEHKYNKQYDCQCISQNFTGNDCENEPCSENNCLHGGHCYTNSDGSTKCMCLSIWTGDYCENFDICGGDDSCLNGGTCTPSPDGNSKTCTCVDGWEGDVCQNSKFLLFSHIITFNLQ